MAAAGSSVHDTAAETGYAAVIARFGSDLILADGCD
jgi:hypothetical protein